MLDKNDSTKGILKTLTHLGSTSIGKNNDSLPEPNKVYAENQEAVQKHSQTTEPTFEPTLGDSFDLKDDSCNVIPEMDEENTTIEDEIQRIQSLTLKEQVNSFKQIDSSQLKLIVRIGGGPRSDVFSSKWNDSLAVIKKIRFSKERKQICHKMYWNEIKAMGILTEAKASNIIQFIGYDIEDACHEKIYVQSNFNIIMEYAIRGSLKQIIQNYLPLNWDVKYKFLRDIACGLKHIHLHGIIHRDIKSANIVINQYWQAKITDFGIAVFKNELPFNWAGTLNYMAPESLVPQALYSEKSDIFSFAVTACEVVLQDNMKNLLRKDIFSDKKNNKITSSGLYNYLVQEKRVTLPKACPTPLAKLITWAWKSKPEDRPTASEAEKFLDKELSSYHQLNRI